MGIFKKIHKAIGSITDPITDPLGSLFGDDKNKQYREAIKQEVAQKAGFKEQEKAKYQAMVDAVYGGSAKQKKLSPGRPDSIYSTSSQGGIFNI